MAKEDEELRKKTVQYMNTRPMKMGRLGSSLTVEDVVGSKFEAGIVNLLSRSGATTVGFAGDNNQHIVARGLELQTLMNLADVGLNFPGASGYRSRSH